MRLQRQFSVWSFQLCPVSFKAKFSIRRAPCSKVWGARVDSADIRTAQTWFRCFLSSLLLQFSSSRPVKSFQVMKSFLKFLTLRTGHSLQHPLIVSHPGSRPVTGSLCPCREPDNCFCIWCVCAHEHSADLPLLPSFINSTDIWTPATCWIPGIRCWANQRINPPSLSLKWFGKDRHQVRKLSLAGRYAS